MGKGLIEIVRARMASHPGGFSRTGISVMGLRVGAAALAFVAQIAAARLVGAEAFGSYALVLVWLFLLGHGATVGTNQLVCRFVSEYRAKGDAGAALGLLHFALALALGVSLIVTLVALAIIHFGPTGLSPQMVTLATLAFLVIPLLVLQEFLEAIARGLDKPLLGIGPAMLLRHLAILAGVGFVFATGGSADAVTIMSFTVGGLAASVAVQYLLLRGELKKLLAGARATYRIGCWFKVAMPVALLEASEILFHNADILILGLFMPPEIVAFYFAATRLAQILSYVPYGISAATAQKYAALAAQGERHELQRLVGAATTLSTTLAIAGALFLWVFAGPLLALFGDGYDAATSVVPVLCLGIVMACALGPGEDILTMTGGERLCALGFFIALFANLALNFTLIPIMGMTGAAIATATALALRGIILAIFAHRQLGIVLPAGFSSIAATAHQEVRT
ncbi:lipopolysaccharide biosynthesis protein [Aliihoeflea sp. PC F10.4]